MNSTRSRWTGTSSPNALFSSLRKLKTHNLRQSRLLSFTSSARTAAPSSSPTPTATGKQSRFQRAVFGLKSNPASHLTSFLVLHEVTAIGLLLPFYYFFQSAEGWSAGILGGPLVGSIGSRQIPNSIPWVGGKRVEQLIEQWVDEGTKKVARVGLKYGYWGFQRVSTHKQAEKDAERAVEGGRDVQTSNHGNKVSGESKNLGLQIRGRALEAMSGIDSKKVLDAVAAYMAVKALFVPRIALSLALTPLFARRVVEPAWRAIRTVFRRGPAKPLA